MKSRQKSGNATGIGDAAVQAKTGKIWSEWYALLDRAGAKNMDHKEIASYVHEELGCPPWWSQMVTVGYEQERGLREKYQSPDGYSASASKTIPVPIATLYQAWSNARTRSRWLPKAAFTVRKAAANKSLRITWEGGATNVDVQFYAKGPGKSQVTVQHDKLRDAKEVARLKDYWTKALERLKEMLSE